MNSGELAGVLDFLRAAERLKSTTRTGYTSTGQQESVAEHTWRLCLMALVLRPAFPDVDFAKLVKICIIHDLGEAIHGDVSAPEQARRAAQEFRPASPTRSVAICSSCSPRCRRRCAMRSPRSGTNTRRPSRRRRSSRRARQARDDHAAQPGPESGRTSTIGSISATGASIRRTFRSSLRCVRSSIARRRRGRARRMPHRTGAAMPNVVAGAREVCR